MNVFKNILIYTFFGILMTFIGKGLNSHLLFDYLKDNILGLLLTLLAINTATLGLIASKIQDVFVLYLHLDFSVTLKEMKLSLKEQIVMIIVSIFTILVIDSDKVIFNFKIDIGNVILSTILIYSIHILWDTGKAVFVIIEELQKIKKK